MNGQSRPHRVAVLAHGHPALSAGGAEIAARTLHDAFRQMPDIASLHIACVPAGHPLAARARRIHEDEAFFETGSIDPFRMANRDPAALEHLLSMIRAFEPDTVHLHHVLGFGAEVLFALRDALPDVRIVLTLHEFLLICHRQGQMVRGEEMTLCERATPADCNRCFPDIAPMRFLRRERALLALFSTVDRFIAPSAFLAARYAAWGLPRARITVLENAIAPLGGPPPAGERRGLRGRFAFFGQITPFKGIDVLLAAVASIADEDWHGCSLDVHGGSLDRQPPEFRERVTALLEQAAPRVTFHGPYANADLPRLMAGVDWVVVPSVWWENSPVVIQEAFRSGRPVIAGDIGGMAEKVRDTIDGLSFRAGDAMALAERMKAARSAPLWEELSRNIIPPVSAEATAAAHLAIYRSLRPAAQHAVQAPMAFEMSPHLGEYA